MDDKAPASAYEYQPTGRRSEMSVTREMIEAGLKVFYDGGIVDDPSPGDKVLVAEIYRAMVSTAHHP